MIARVLVAVLLVIGCASAARADSTAPASLDASLTAAYQAAKGDALLEALRSGQIGAAWLDVTEPEPLPDEHSLRAEPNCFITPHVAGGHAGETKTLVRHFLTNFKRFVRGEPLLDRVM